MGSVHASFGSAAKLEEPECSLTPQKWNELRQNSVEMAKKTKEMPLVDVKLHDSSDRSLLFG